MARGGCPGEYTCSYTAHTWRTWCVQYIWWKSGIPFRTFPHRTFPFICFTFSGTADQPTWEGFSMICVTVFIQKKGTNIKKAKESKYQRPVFIIPFRKVVVPVIKPLCCQKRVFVRARNSYSHRVEQVEAELYVLFGLNSSSRSCLQPGYCGLAQIVLITRLFTKWLYVPYIFHLLRQCWLTNMRGFHYPIQKFSCSSNVAKKGTWMLFVRARNSYLGWTCRGGTTVCPRPTAWCRSCW